jgi:hypothetical protein
MFPSVTPPLRRAYVLCQGPKPRDQRNWPNVTTSRQPPTLPHLARLQHAVASSPSPSLLHRSPSSSRKPAFHPRSRAIDALSLSAKSLWSPHPKLHGRPPTFRLSSSADVKSSRDRRYTWHASIAAPRRSPSGVDLARVGRIKAVYRIVQGHFVCSIISFCFRCYALHSRLSIFVLDLCS